ncbi:MAG: LON peptidase substrate-binding domain-containing protein, partial [Treponema sp.]|nr:LON peptidase substrate-binding domain-containing protein [Treponema sp.]
MKPYQGLLQFIAGFGHKAAADRAPPAGRKRAAGRGIIKTEAEELVLLPLKDLVLFPNTTVPVFLAYQSGIIAVEEALRRDHRLFASRVLNSEGRETMLAQPGRGEEGFPGPLFPVSGTAARILQRLRLPDGSIRVILQGEYRGTIAGISRRPLGGAGRRGAGPENEILSYNLVRVTAIPGLPPGAGDTGTIAMIRAIQRAFAQYAELSKKIGPDISAAVERTENPERLANLVSNAMAINTEKKQALLSIRDGETRLETVLETLEMEIEIYSVQQNISGKVKSRMEKNQREYILQEQLKEINKELGKDGAEDEYADLEKAVAERNPPEEILAKAQKEIGRLRKLQPFSPEAGVLRAYVEWIRDLPWSEYSPDSV